MLHSMLYSQGGIYHVMYQRYIACYTSGILTPWISRDIPACPCIFGDNFVYPHISSIIWG